MRQAGLSPFLALRPVPPPPPQARSAMLWGEPSVARVAVRTAAAAVARGVSVALIDAALAFDVTAVTAYAQARRVPPEPFLRQIHLARAFTCHQLTTLLCERLDPLLASQHIGLVVLLGPCTTFVDEHVPFKEAFFLFQRALRKIRELCQHGPLLLMAQGRDPHATRRIAFVRELVHAVEVGIWIRTVDGRRHVQLLQPRAPGTPQVFPSRSRLQQPEVAQDEPNASPR